METLDDWRTGLRVYLSERIGEELLAGDLFDRFGSNMPLHHATRCWTRGGGRIGTTPHHQMRWRAFSDTLRHLNVRFEPELSHRVGLKKETAIIAQSVTCPCGQVFFGQANARFCTRLCGGSNWRRIQAEPEKAIAPRVKRTGRRTHRYTLGLTESEFQAVKETAHQRNLHIADVLREALRDWLRTLKMRQAAE